MQIETESLQLNGCRLRPMRRSGNRWRSASRVQILARNQEL